MTNFEYDGLSRRTDEHWFASATSSTSLHSFAWSYNLDGTLASAGDTVADYDYTHDTLSRLDLTTVHYPQLNLNLQLDANYDALSRRASLNASLGSSLLATNAYQYDVNSRTAQITQTGPNVSGKQVDFTYNAAGQFETLTHSKLVNGATVGLGQSTYGYYLVGRLTALSHHTGASMLAAFGWQYDDLNRLTAYSDSLDDDRTFAYDATGQLTGVNCVNGTTDYEWYASGNPTSSTATSTYQVSPGNLLMQDEAFSYTYDAEGNRKTKTDRATGEGAECTWDHRDQVVEVTFRDANSSPLSAIDYVHDVLDHRISARSAAAEISRGEITPVTSTDAASCGKACLAKGGTAGPGYRTSSPARKLNLS